MKDLKDKADNSENVVDIFDQALLRFKKLPELYSTGDIKAKRYIIGSIFPEKWTIFENRSRTEKPNLAAQLIFQINSFLDRKKPE